MPSRIAVCECAIDALSLAAIEELDSQTAYVSTRGGLGVAAPGEIERLPAHAEQLIGATDQGYAMLRRPFFGSVEGYADIA